MVTLLNPNLVSQFSIDVAREFILELSFGSGCSRVVVTRILLQRSWA